MELTAYWGVLRRWSLLVIGGTLVAILVGDGLWLRDRRAMRPRDVGTAIVLVRYVTPPGIAGTSMRAVQAETEVLSERVHDPGVLPRVAAQAHVALSQVQQVSTSVDPEKPLITVRVVGGSPQAVAAVAQGLAGYLVQVETQRVQAQAASLSRTAARVAAQAERRWRDAQAHYYLVCGCIAGQHQATVDPATLARLRFALSNLRATYLAAADRYTALQTNSVPVAIATPGVSARLTTTYPPLMRAVLPAAVLGVLVSMGLATLLDHRRAGRRPAPVHASAGLMSPEGET
jgi:hypothetical protein